MNEYPNFWLRAIVPTTIVLFLICIACYLMDEDINIAVSIIAIYLTFGINLYNKYENNKTREQLESIKGILFRKLK